MCALTLYSSASSLLFLLPRLLLKYAGLQDHGQTHKNSLNAHEFQFPHKTRMRTSSRSSSGSGAAGEAQPGQLSAGFGTLAAS